mmetsp:Transcript_100798/g.159437  ORF Transcript_100798/g.159437 Transcript_100798/m.159437 type:complete len:96 (-) Transcript_100798:32-319(-)
MKTTCAGKHPEPNALADKPRTTHPWRHQREIAKHVFLIVIIKHKISAHLDTVAAIGGNDRADSPTRWKELAELDSCRQTFDKKRYIMKKSSTTAQ